MRQLISRHLYNIVLLLITVLFFCGGLGVRLYWVEITGFIFSGICLLLIFIRKDKIWFPPGFFIYLSFILILLISLVWSKNFFPSLEFFFLFTSAGFFWILFYNLKNRLSKNFDISILSIGLLFSILFLLYKFLKIDLINTPWNLYSKYSENHNHLGDYLTIVILVLINLMQTKIKWWHLIILPIGLFLIAISLSRSAYLALFVGIIFLFTRKYNFNNYKKFFWLAILIIAVMFIISGFTKTTFFSRPYFFQAVTALIKNPLGFGMGNFGQASRLSSSFLSLNNTAAHAHNIFLEVFSGIGIFGTVFIFWFIKVFSSVLKNKDKSSLIFQTIFLAITANFLFDSTYYLPTMLWLWFSVLGLSQSKFST